MAQKDAQIKKDLMQAYTLAVEQKHRADNLGKKLVLIVGERHTSRNSLAIQLMVEFAFSDLGISRVAVEFDQQRMDEGDQINRHFLSSHFQNFNNLNGDEKRKLIKELPKIMKDFETEAPGRKTSNPKFMAIFHALNGTESFPFDPLWEVHCNKDIILSDADNINRERAMIDSLEKLAVRGNLYVTTGWIHAPILVESLRQHGGFLVPYIECTNLAHSQEAACVARSVQSKSLATWIPKICERPEIYTASQAMSVVLDVLSEARKKHGFLNKANSKPDRRAKDDYRGPA